MSSAGGEGWPVGADGGGVNSTRRRQRRERVFGYTGPLRPERFAVVGIGVCVCVCVCVCVVGGGGGGWSEGGLKIA